ncbi:MAG: alpha/beta fold hydrolase [Myxococcota bacterium]
MKRLALFLVACGASTPSAEMHESPTYLELRASHQTRLTRRGPIADEWPDDPVPEGAERVTYPSGELELWGWLSIPEGAEAAPALVYLHGDRFLQARDWALLAPFRDAGFAVLTPTLRGRNGNPGVHELLLGEVDDARAAVRYAKAHPAIDAERVYLIGHSMGGATAALASLFPNDRPAMSASIGGIYSRGTFASWSRGGDSNLVPFAASDPDEVAVRLFPLHVDQLQVPHVAYMGDQERRIQQNAREAQARAPANLFEVHVVPGTHMSARAPALADFLDRVASR